MGRGFCVFLCVLGERRGEFKAPTLPQKQNREGWGTLKVSRPRYLATHGGLATRPAGFILESSSISGIVAAPSVFPLKAFRKVK
jgi:hypothetical protein